MRKTKLAYFQNRTMNEQGEQQKEVICCIVVCPLDAKYVDWVEYVERILLCQFTVRLVPRIETELENILDYDQHLTNKHTEPG